MCFPWTESPFEEYVPIFFPASVSLSIFRETKSGTYHLNHSILDQGLCLRERNFTQTGHEATQTPQSWPVQTIEIGMIHTKLLQSDLMLSFVNLNYEGNKEESGLQLQAIISNTTQQISLLLHRENQALGNCVPLSHPHLIACLGLSFSS